MAGIQTSEVDAEFLPANMGAWTVRFGNHENTQLSCDS
jgi:hypothetical protein